jgi:hypothetical protein
MAIRNCKPALRIVQEGDTAPTSLTILAGTPPQRLRVEEQDVDRVRLNIAHSSFTSGLMLNPAAACGVEAFLQVQLKGATKLVRCDVAHSADGADVVVPRGTIARWLAEAH